MAAAFDGAARFEQESFNVQRTAYPGATQRNNDPEQCFLRAGPVAPFALRSLNTNAGIMWLF